MPLKPLSVLTVLVCLPLVAAQDAANGEKGLQKRLVVIHADAPQPAPEWAILERHLFETINRAAVEFVKTYTLPDGSVRWKERYEGGMNSWDDMYEAFRGFSLFCILGGAKEIDTRHRHIWEGITHQYQRYGNIHRDFVGNWDWMHIGEGYVSFYPLGLADPTDSDFRERAIRFAGMYIGEDPEAPNYDPERKQMRSSMTGSYGPKLKWSKRDWIPTNANLVYLFLPFDDIPGVTSVTGWINDHPENDEFGRVVQTMSDRMARGDIPLNLYSAALVANAFLYTGEEKYRLWVKDYLGAWIERTKANEGITPDNIGVSGKVGKHNDGNWWGGYYGWQWIEATRAVRAEIVAAKVAMLLTGDAEWLDLPRSQVSVMRERGRVENGVTLVPVRYSSKKGWHQFETELVYPYINLWYMSQSKEDWEQIERLARSHLAEEKLAPSSPPERIRDLDLGWAYFLRGENPSFPERAFKEDLKLVARMTNRIMNEHGDPETWYDGHWSNLDPVPTENLIRLTVGGTPVPKKGEMLFSRLRYFDLDRLEPGLPQGVATLVTRMGNDFVEVELVNTNLFESRQLVVQAGAYGEHTFTEVTYLAATEEQPPGARSTNSLVTEKQTVAVGKPYFQVNLDPGAGAQLRIDMRRYVNKPTYEFPWQRGARPAR